MRLPRSTLNPNRIFLFLFGCIGVRSLFVYIAKKIDRKHLPKLGLLALIPVLGWLNIYFFNPRNTGPEVFGERIWWNQLRIVHALTYICFAIFAFQQKWFSYMPLLFDVVFGLLSWTIYHRYTLKQSIQMFI